MARFDTTRTLATNKGGGHIYSVVGRTTTASGVDVDTQCGMFGKIGALLTDDVYEFLPLKEGDTLADAYAITALELDPEETFEGSSIVSYAVPMGAIVDAVQVQKGDKFAISVDGIEKAGGIADTGYVYATQDNKKLQYHATLPSTGEKPIVIGKIEKIYDTGAGGIAGANGKSISLNYKMVKFRIL